MVKDTNGGASLELGSELQVDEIEKHLEMMFETLETDEV